MSTALMIPVYMTGALASFYLGWRTAFWRMAKDYEYDLNRAYNRGVKAGREYLDRIKDEKLDMISTMRILTGEELEE